MKRGQVAYIDMFLSILVFIAAMTFFFKSEVNASRIEESILDDLVLESRNVGDLIMSQGTPTNWTNGTVREVGLVQDYHLTQAKLDSMRSMTYDNMRNKLRTKYDFYMYFTSKYGPVDIGGYNFGIGKPGVNSTNVNQVEDPDHIVKAARFAYYENVPVRITLLLWV